MKGVWGERRRERVILGMIFWKYQILFLKYFIYLFLERGREGEREGEKHQCVVASHMPQTGDPACKPSMCPRLGIQMATLWFTGWHSVH